MATAYLPSALRLPARTAAETGGPPPRPRTGPVLMGDIHGQLGGTPLLLLLWRRWEEEARDDAER
jgi:hypothetical protein